MFYKNTDTIDIDAKSIGVTTFSYPNRGLSIQIRHNREKELFKTANEMASFIAASLNEAIELGTIKLPESNK